MNASKIIGMQFSLFSPEEIRQASVVEITSKDTYTNNKPCAHGLFDIRMGVLEPGYICPTDGLDYMESPGYFGHYNIAQPVFYTQYMSSILKILKCICFQCSKLLINKHVYRDALDMSPDHRWKYIFNLASVIKRCGQEIDDGCGCVQPKFRKEALCAIYAEWKNNNPATNNKINIKLSAEAVLNIFQKISDEDITFLGFHPLWARPEWMICQVLLVPPPSVRPSIKPDNHQRCEDDLTHILTQIIRVNQILQDKLKQPAPNPATIDDYANVLQCFVSAQYDNKLCGGANVAQRSGRPLKSIRDRLNGKAGRMRGNLMAKRVNFSARSVITADPNLSIRELGIPLKIAKNMTKPVVVNDRNKAFLTKLVRNGADAYPGAKLLQRKRGGTITLKYFKDRDVIQLDNGDVVHRHMLNGDPVLFNRQPTLHRMSMMCHLARIMRKGDTFRMNVADTKPYNADFDGDEMNLHMPQDLESDSELHNLAAVRHQIVSPATNSTIIGIFQDSMLGSYLFTRPRESFPPLQAMGLLMNCPCINEDLWLACLDGKPRTVSNWDILSQIMPPLSLKYPVEYKIRRDESADGQLEIKAGRYLRGQMEKGVLGGKGRSLIHRICNDFGSQAAADFIDNLQNIITEYLKTCSFSVGVSDLLLASLADKEQIQNIILEKKQEVLNIIDETKLGVLENNSGKSNREEVESRVNDILNQTIKNTEQVGLKSLGAGNRFKIMVDAGSKGSELNIAQMVSCVGQQNVDGKRIPYSYDNRTLPHFCQFDDSAEARGFVENSYVNGLTPQELFFHAMGGRVGLIDTAVKTSTTGYIQRRLVKGLEDLMVGYDMTVRNSKERVIQFSYGDDGIDPIKVESQPLPLATMSMQDVFLHFNLLDEPASRRIVNMALDKVALRVHSKQMPDYRQRMKEMTEEMLRSRERIVKHVFRFKSESVVCCPVAFFYIIQNVTNQLGLHENSVSDISPLDALTLIDETWNKRLCALCPFAPPSPLFKVLYYFHLSAKELVFAKRVNRTALVLILEHVVLQYKKAVVNPGEMVGIIAAQSIGEPTTQLTLNTFHYAGVSSKTNVTRGVPRIEEVLSLTAEAKKPSLTVFLPPEEETDRERAQAVMYLLEHTQLKHVVSSVQICFDSATASATEARGDNDGGDNDNDFIQHFLEFEDLLLAADSDAPPTKRRSPWVIRLEMNSEIMLEKNITMDDIHFVIKAVYKDDVSCVYSDYNADKLVFRIHLASIEHNQRDQGDQRDQTDQIFKLKEFMDQLLENILLRGVKDLKKVSMRKVKDQVVEVLGTYKRQESWVLDTLGTNLLEVLSMDFIDKRRTFSNNIKEMYDVLGIEAARQSIFNELSEVIEFEGTYINYHHLCLLVDRMCYTHKMIAISRHGINVDDIGPNAKASFEETPEMFLKAAKHGELDFMRGVSANLMCGQEGMFGTNAFQLFYDEERGAKGGDDGLANMKQRNEDDGRGEEERGGEGGEVIDDDAALWAKLEMGGAMMML